MSDFESFEAQYGTGDACVSVPSASIDAYRDIVPDPLLELWQERGWCGYDKGFVWTTDPGMYADVLEDWLDPDEGYVVVGRTGLADLFLWREDGIKVLYTQFGKIARIGPKVELFFNYALCQEYFVNDSLDRPLFLAGLKRLGPLEQDECYALEPVLALGGEPSGEFLAKVKIREYLGILAQVVLE